ncbi:MAG: 5,10-methylenetetrahydrofolate reductase [Sandaracinaceae bacterium]|nr:5,10-methylenetetrahydrofolate reductase [Sandaracinaceae bacterium]
MSPDALIVYDIQPETERTDAPRPFPFLPTLDPERYAADALASVDVPKIVYRCVPKGSRADFMAYLDEVRTADAPRHAVLVGAPGRDAYPTGLPLSEAYRLTARHAPELMLGGIAIAERHAHGATEHLRMLEKTQRGCRFFVTQAVYDVSGTKSLLSDYALALAERGEQPVPVIVTLSPCGSEKTLAFMKWLGISFPRWLENELLHSSDVLGQSLALCEQIHTELSSFAAAKGIPLGVNIESVSIRRAEIDASVELFRRLRGK